MPPAGKRAKRRAPVDPRAMSREDLERLIHESERKIELIEGFENSEEWRVLSKYLDGRLLRMEHEGKGLRRRVMRPIAGQPPVTLEVIAAHEARIDEDSLLRRLPKVILGLWRDQLQELHAIRVEAAR